MLWGAAQWVLVLVAIIGAVVAGTNAVDAFSGQVAEAAAIAHLANDAPEVGGDAQAAIFPPTDFAGAQNCDASNRCREMILAQQTATGYTYTSFDFVPGATLAQGALKIATMTGLQANWAPIGLSQVGTIPMQSFFWHPELASQMHSDALDPYAGLVTQLETQAGQTSKDVSLSYGPFGVVGKNVVVLASGTSSTGNSVQFFVALRNVAPQNLMLTAGGYAPSPPPGLNAAPASFVFHWPGDASQQVTLSEQNYHDAYFVEAQPAGSACATNINQVENAGGTTGYDYQPGISPVYHPSTDWGRAGPWLYPNPNPTTPPASYGTFGTIFTIDPASAGFCTLGYYDVYHDRNLASPVSGTIDVMGQLAANPTALSYLNPNNNASTTIALTKTFDDKPIVATTNAASCAGIVNVGPGAPASFPAVPAAAPPSEIDKLITPVVDPKTGKNAGGSSGGVFDAVCGRTVGDGVSEHPRRHDAHSHGY